MVQNPVMIAGDPERQASAERSEKGIPVDQESWNGILKAGEKVGIEKERLASYLSEVPG